MTKPWLMDVEGDQVPQLIDSDARTIRVESGPGTGKTFGLVRRVQRLLHPDGLGVPGDEVLVVAFNRVIAKELQKDVAAALERSPHNKEPHVSTIHALALSILGGDLRLLLPDERAAMLYDIRNSVPALTNDYANISRMDQALKDHEANIDDAPNLWLAVEQWLVRHNAQLVSQIPPMLLSRMMGGDFTELSYRHVIVDEFQDLTPAEQELVLRLRRSDGSLVALGDPRQSIYAFRGNDRRGLEKLDDRLAGEDEWITDVALTECNRCPGGVVRAANRLMTLHEAEPMVATSPVAENIHVIYFKTPRAEAKGMAQAILDNHRDHPDEVHLVMVPRRRFGYRLREALATIDGDLPIHLSFSEFILDDQKVREAFMFFCLLADPDPPTWRAWLGMQIDKNGHLKEASQRNSDSYLRFLKATGDQITDSQVRRLASEVHSTHRGTGGRYLWGLANRYVTLSNSLGWDGTVSGLIEAVLGNYELFDIDPIESPMSVRDLGSLKQKAIQILAEQNSEDAEAMKLKQVARTLRHHIATKEPFESPEGSGVTISTLWGAKGMTAENVYVLGLFNEAIPGKRLDSYPGTELEHLEEQRRLFYVSITRTKRTLVLSRPSQMRRTDGPPIGVTLEPGPGWWAQLSMCRFLSLIQPELRDAVAGESWSGCSS